MHRGVVGIDAVDKSVDVNVLGPHLVFKEGVGFSLPFEQRRYRVTFRVQCFEVNERAGKKGVL